MEMRKLGLRYPEDVEKLEPGKMYLVDAETGELGEPVLLPAIPIPPEEDSAAPTPPPAPASRE